MGLPLWSTLGLACGVESGGSEDVGLRHGIIDVRETLPIEEIDTTGESEPSTTGIEASTSGSPATTDIDPSVGASSSETGDSGSTWGDAGGTWGDAGGTWGDAGGTWGDAGGTWGDAGGTSGDGGTWGDGGGTWGDAGGTWGDAGGTSGDGGTWGDAGGTWGDAGGTWGDSGTSGDDTTGGDEDPCGEVVSPGPFTITSEIQAADFYDLAELTRPFPLSGPGGFANFAGVPAELCTSLDGDGSYTAFFENYQDKNDPGTRDAVSGVYLYFDGLAPGAVVVASGVSYDAASLNARESSIYLPEGIGSFDVMGQGAQPVQLQYAVINLHQIDLIRQALDGPVLEGILGADERVAVGTEPVDIRGKTGGIHKVVFEVTMEVNAADEAANGAILLPDPMKKGATIPFSGMTFPNGCTGWLNGVPGNKKGRAISNSHCVKEADGGMAPKWITQMWKGNAYRIRQNIKTKPADVRLTFGWTAGAEPAPQYKGMTINKIDSANDKDIVVWDMVDALAAADQVKYAVSKAARALGTEVWVAGHGAGAVMKVSYQKTVGKAVANAKLVEITTAHVYQHNADTLGGSSGSPVFLRGGADADKVTCLHHAAATNLLGKVVSNECTSFDEICKIAGFAAIIDGC